MYICCCCSIYTKWCWFLAQILRNLIINLTHFHRGMTVTSGSVVIKKDQTHLIGISIGGGAPYCPCLYIVQV